jgi:hypothetical protein
VGVKQDLHGGLQIPHRTRRAIDSGHFSEKKGGSAGTFIELDIASFDDELRKKASSFLS